MSGRGARRRSLRLLAVAGAVGVAVVAIGMLTRSSDLPEPYATQKDLPPIPDAKRNGWTRLAGAWSDSALDLNDEALMASFATRVETSSSQQRWERVLENQAGVRRAANAALHQEVLAAWHSAAEAEEFADGCQRNVDEVCGYFLYYKMHQLAMVEILRDALDDRWANANRRLARALTMDRRFLSSCRDSFGATVASAAIGEALALTDLLLGRQPPKGADDGRQALWSAVRRLDGEDDVLEGFEVRRRAFVGHYLFQRRLLKAVEQEGVEVLTGNAMWPPSALYDPVHSAKLIDEVHLGLRSEHGMHLVLMGRDDDVEPIRCSWMDRATNPIGCSHFDPDEARLSHDRSMARIDESLEVARRWLGRIQDKRR